MGAAFAGMTSVICSQERAEARLASRTRATVQR
jgi:hypothetical protein